MSTEFLIPLDGFVLRKPEPKDAEAIFRNYTQDPEVTRYLLWKPHQSLQDSRDWIEHCIEVFDAETHPVYVIAEPGADEAIGMIDARVSGHQALVGYVLARSYWGQGIMTRALRFLVDTLIARPGVYRVYALHDVDNPASGRVMEKAGMRYEGLLKRAGMHPTVSDEPRDSKLWARTK
jgi:RimJ/RimL family protein N-acetyltransferase